MPGYIKWSSLPSTTATTAGDTVVGLHSGANEQFLVSATPSASGIALWDANSNISASNVLEGYATTATAAGTTTLTVASKRQQYFTGSTTQTVTLPVTSTLALGQSFYIVNNSTGIVTVQSSGANTVQAMGAGTALLVTCILASGTTAASWSFGYFNLSQPTLVWSTISGTTQAALVNNGYIVGNVAQTTITLPSTAPVGSIISVVGKGAAGWIVTANGGQTINLGTSATSAGGTLTSAAATDTLDLICITADTTWSARAAFTAGLTVA